MKSKSGVLLTGMLLLAPIASAATLDGSTVTTTEPLTVHLSGTAALMIEPVETLLAGEHPAGLTLANWQASVTAGTVAYRLTPGLVQPIVPAQPAVGLFSELSNPSHSILVALVTTECINTATDSGWVVCPEGVSQATGKVNLQQSQSVSKGTYRIGIDTVVWGD
ncbi:hypothetical protein [Providencia rettgeri]|uniref:hypothetical protein n=1 Tax=Providencia rettgeri TaxID=587 RepID=UPI0011DCE168|nr:hypothetical protein [Providencia rettgeri]QXA59586.1 hypothetical protein I6L79_08795 [Providencia rettgeri]